MKSSCSKLLQTASGWRFHSARCWRKWLSCQSRRGVDFHQSMKWNFEDKMGQTIGMWHFVAWLGNVRTMIWEGDRCCHVLRHVHSQEWFFIACVLAPGPWLQKDSERRLGPSRILGWTVKSVDASWTACSTFQKDSLQKVVPTTLNWKQVAPAFHVWYINIWFILAP